MEYCAFCQAENATVPILDKNNEPIWICHSCSKYVVQDHLMQGHNKPKEEKKFLHLNVAQKEEKVK